MAFDKLTEDLLNGNLWGNKKTLIKENKNVDANRKAIADKLANINTQIENLYKQKEAIEVKIQALREKQSVLSEAET